MKYARSANIKNKKQERKLWSMIRYKFTTCCLTDPLENWICASTYVAFKAELYNKFAEKQVQFSV